MPTVAPYGTWVSPVSAENLARGAIGVSSPRAVDGRLYWLENRPEQRGRLVAITGDANGFRELTPDGFNVRTRVHEYGGAPYTVIGQTLYFANFADQRLYAQTGGAAPVALTPEGYRYADLVARPGGGLIGVREDHTDPADVRNTIVALSGEPGDAGRVLFGASDFVAYPRLSPDGRQLAWMAWDHPNMPWDDTTLYVGDLEGDRVVNVQPVAGGVGESAMEPVWSPDGVLHFNSDRSGFWNLYALRNGKPQPVLPMDAEFAGPLWGLGQSNYVFMGGDGRIVASYGGADGDHLVVIAGAEAREVPTPFSSLGSLQTLDDRTVALLAGSALESGVLATIDIETGEASVVRHPSPTALAPACVSRAEAITSASADGLPVHALYYPPTNPDFTAPAGERPPLIVQAHGGPTGQASASFSLANQFWTSRGFALVDVDYGGSAGYGRAYRQRLNDRWGIVDVEDVIAAVKHLAAQGMIDPNRTAIHGGSAGGFTVLAALSQSEVFKAGASFYGVADLGALARDTHKFESRYLDNLVGPWPEAQAIYDARSPLNHLDGFRTPLIIFQGSEDPIVPPNQAHMILEALRKRQQPVAYLEFAGESHGFRRAENLIAAKQAELYFYGRVFGFKPADDLPEVRIENLAS
ncbi:MAG TPA: prolyl oligopeptidase family serine peptidase [Caulobacteraceae bacterium]|nr:prolyl oligopeptidase family serine peptidase [Caulobacteraceae bacterium]